MDRSLLNSEVDIMQQSLREQVASVLKCTLRWDGVYMYVCICMYICMCVYIHTYVYVYVYVYVYAYINTYIHIYECMYAASRTHIFWVLNENMCSFAILSQICRMNFCSDP